MATICSTLRSKYSHSEILTKFEKFVLIKAFSYKCSHLTIWTPDFARGPYWWSTHPGSGGVEYGFLIFTPSQHQGLEDGCETTCTQTQDKLPI